MKSTEARTSSAGAVSGTRVYDAFGQTVGSTGTWAGPSGYGGAFGYREDGTALRLVGHRLYDPAAGRFLSRDPARDGRNWYAYCEGDPVGRADPEGEVPVLLVIAVLLLAAGTHSGPQPCEQGGPCDDNRGPGDPIRVYPDASPFPGNAVTPGGGTIWLPQGIRPIDFLLSEDELLVDLYNHEVGHIEQARRLGFPWYLVAIAMEFFEHDYEGSSMEQEANTREHDFRGGRVPPQR